ncbi:transposase family protein [Streptomyces sp. NPDC001406]|uniref:transposase family protein n=1 Tax=Streptomyces sp. NPDC001406 TaxID=3364572 RepID=UPI0036B3EF03
MWTSNTRSRRDKLTGVASMCRQFATVCLTKSPTAAQRGVGGVAERLAVLHDLQDRRGRRHSLVSVLLTACCAVLAGARSYLAVGQ